MTDASDMAIADAAQGTYRVIVPVKNGGPRWAHAAKALAANVSGPDRVVVIDSESSDKSDIVAREMGFVVQRIPVRTFNHGRTRQQALEDYAADCQFAVFLTQDAILDSENSIRTLLESFSDAQVAAAFGRQVPHTDATLFEAHAAHFNYSGTSSKRTISDCARLGIKTAYFSNSFAAYRVSALLQQGGFPNHLILGEDTYVAAKLLLAGHAIQYCAEARVRHSHDYSVAEEARRYFDFGVMHSQVPDLLSRFGAPEGEGIAFALSELRFVASRKPRCVPEWLVRNSAKYVAYRLGRIHHILPRKLVRALSMTKVYWQGL